MNRWLVAAALLLPLVSQAGNGVADPVGEPIAAVDSVRLGHDLELLGYATSAPRGETTPPFPLNDSGETACYDGDNAEMTCDPVGYPGQDGRFGRDAAAADGVLPKQGSGDAGFDFTKISATGDELPAGAPEWACVRDNLSGLTWVAEAQNATWGDAMTTLPGDADAASLCGLQGWRLPAVGELAGIMHFGGAAPMIDPGFFPNTAGAQHWTAIEAAHNANNAWVLHFSTGFMGNIGKTLSRDARLVHGATAANEYTPHDDGTATSTDTGLMWSRCTLGQAWEDDTCTGEPQAMRWVEALQAVALANVSEYLGHDDWRLPNIKELISHFDYTQTAPAVDPDVFPNTPGGRFASSTTGGNSPFSFFLVQSQLHGQAGTLNKAGQAGTLGPYVRLVRGGSGFDEYDRVAAAGPGSEIGVSPPALEYELEESDGGETQLLTIANSGAEALAWNVVSPAVGGCYHPGTVSWLSVTPDAGVVAAGADQNLEVAVDVGSLVPGVYETTLCVHNSDASWPRVDVPVTLVLNEDPLPEQPVMEVSPLEISATVFAGETAQRGVTISNWGAETLEWSVGFSGTCDTAPPSWLAVTPGSGSVGSLEQATVVVTLDATDLGAGEFDAVLCVEGNDPDKPAVLIGIDMSVVVQTIVRPLNDSGSAACYDANHFAVVCDPPGLPGQDGRFGRDVAAEHGVLPKTGTGVAGFDFSKLSDVGDELPADAPEWACVRDHTTGLTWAADTGEADWEDAMTVLPGAANGDELCGFEDWRLPTPPELSSIVHFGVFSPAVDAGYFPGTPSQEHWTGTEVPDNASRAFTLDFDSGAMNNLRDKSTLQAVRLVRGESASGDYVDHGDGTVTSVDTGLMWSRCSFGQHWDGDTCAGDAITMQQWSDLLLAVATANDAEFLGYGDWRMPNAKELASITDHTRTLPAVDPEIFPNTPPFNNFVSATTNGDNASQSWNVQASGLVRSQAKGTAFKAVRLVRAGAPFDDYDRLAPGGAPEIQVSPAALNFEVDFGAGGNETGFLSIANAGTADLEWNLFEPAAGGCFEPGEVSWLSAAPGAGSLAPAGEQTVEVTAGAGGLPPGTYQTTLCVHSNDAGNPRVDVPVTLVVAGDPLPEHPVIDIDPESLSEVVFAGETTETAFTVGNLGGETLSWTVGFFGTAGLLGSEVLWDQPATGSGSIASDYFIGHPDGDAGIYSADDFLIDWGRQITGIVTPGAWSSQFPNGTVADADTITWRIYSDAGGVPAGHPEDDDPLWSLTLAPDHPAVTIDDEDIALDIVAAEGAGIVLDAGRYWLSVTPEIAYQTSIANRWNWRQGLPRETGGRMIDPQNLFNIGATDWTSFQDAGLSWTDVAFTLYGTQAELECDSIPPDWLAVAPASGNTPPLATDAVTVTLDASGLPAGDYEAVLCVESDDPDHPMRLVTVNLSVVLPPTDQPLNDTGQQLCYGTNNIPESCDPPAFPGQDGRYGRDAAADDGVLPKIGGGVEGFDFTKISNGGDPLPADAQLGSGPDDWACTRDNTTGLIWAVETHAGSWNDAMDALIPDTNDAALCGFTDWRLPGYVELHSLVHYGLTQEKIDPDYFPLTAQGTDPFANAYFAAETVANNTIQRWTVNFLSGTVTGLISSAARRVQLVRGNPVVGELVINDDHTVTDTRTQLVWDRCSLGQEWNGSTCAGSAATLTWQAALNAVAAANADGHLGYSDWRLPNNKELPSQCDLARANPSVDSAVFPGTASGMYWTSTTTVGTVFEKYVVNFSMCRTGGNNPDTGLHHVRMVRGGNPFDRYDRLGEPPPEHPVITLDPDSVAVTLDEGGSLDRPLIVGNAGGETLTWAFETGAGCDLPTDVDWLTAAPVSGDVPAGGETTVTLGFAAGDLSPGEYGAMLCIASNDPDNALAELPVAMTVSGTPEPATVEGTVEGLGYCDASPGALAGAEVTIQGTGGAEVLSTDGNGFYQTTMNPQQGPVDITVTADGHQSQAMTGVALAPGATVVRDFNLRALLGCTEAEQDALETVLETGANMTLTLTLNNSGLLDAGFSVSSAAGWLEFDPAFGTVAAEGSAEVGVTFNAPADPGTYTADIEITVDDGAGAFVIEVPATMTVENAGAPEIGVTPDSVSATVVSGGTAQHDVTIANTGDRDLDWTFGGGSYGNLATGGNHVTISHSASLEIVDSNAIACSPDGGFTTSSNRFLRVFDLTGFGFQNDFDVNSVTFGLERLDVTANVSVNLYTLDGALAYANLTSVASEMVTLEPQVSVLIDVPVIATLPADAILVVEIEPQELSGIGHFYPGSNSAGESALSYLSAPVCGAAEPVATADSHVHLVMAVGGQTAGGLPLECERPEDVEWLAAGPTAGTVAPGGAQDMTLTFDAGDLPEGGYEARLCLVSNDPENPVVSLPVAMTVEAAPDPGQLQVSPAALDFGQVAVGTTAVSSFEIANAAAPGAMALTLDTVVAIGNPEFSISGCQAGAVLQPQESCTVDVSFTPGGESAFAGAVEIITTDGQDAAVSLAGAGEDPEPPGDDIFTDRFEQQVP